MSKRDSQTDAPQDATSPTTEDAGLSVGRVGTGGSHLGYRLAFAGVLCGGVGLVVAAHDAWLSVSSSSMISASTTSSSSGVDAAAAESGKDS